MSTPYVCRQCFKKLRSTGSLGLGKCSPSTGSANRIGALQLSSARLPKVVTLPVRVRHQSTAATQNQEVRYEPPRKPTRAEDSRLHVGEQRDVPTSLLLRPDDLFHTMSDSPIPEMRRRAAYIKSHAQCPHPHHQRTRLPQSPTDPEGRKTTGTDHLPPRHVRFECPDCGIPTYCSEDHWADDYEHHMDLCETLRQINEDDHDIRSGRVFPEFDYPHLQDEEFHINMSNWDTLFYTREFNAINSDRSLRQVTQQLTYPMTIASVLSDYSPYMEKSEKRVTHEGLRSFNALRYNLHPPLRGEGPGVKGLRPNPPPLRIFILGARAESSLPRDVWHQLAWMFPRVRFHLIFIGPESMMNREQELPLPNRTSENPFGAIVEGRISDQLKISTYVEYYHTLHQAQIFQPFDPYFDCFVLFHPGLGHPASIHEWAETLPQLLETKVPIICTGYTEWDMERDRQWAVEKVGGEMDVLLEPGENKFRSLRWDLNDLDPQDVTCGNWGVWAFRGKRYEATTKDTTETTGI